jgi:hypothetical protein
LPSRSISSLAHSSIPRRYRHWIRDSSPRVRRRWKWAVPLRVIPVGHNRANQRRSKTITRSANSRPYLNDLRPLRARAGAPLLLNQIGGLADALVLPDVEREPAHLDEGTVGPSISTSVLLELRSPPFGVVFWRHVMLWASVPEASIHEHRQPCAGEREVGRAWHPSEDYTESDAPAVKFSPESPFGLGVASRHPRELRRHRLAQGDRTLARHIAILSAGCLQ